MIVSTTNVYTAPDMEMYESISIDEGICAASDYALPVIEEDEFVF